MDFFNDVTVAKIVNSGGKLSTGRITFYLPKFFSFCGGVVRAVKKVVEECIDPSSFGRILLLGEVVHNPDVNRWFVEHGAVILSADQILRIEDQVQAGDVIIIPAFGVKRELYHRLQLLKGVRLVDTTCGDVSVIWDYVQSKTAEGFSLILHGKTGHPETEAILSRVVDGVSVRVVSSFKEAEQLFDQTIDNFDFNKVAFTQQTTMPASETERIKDLLEKKILQKAGAFDACHSICPATQQRQDAAIELCEEELDLIFVVGGFDSSNTSELFAIASRSNTAFYIENSEDVTQENLRHYCPSTGTIKASKNWLKKCHKEECLKWQSHDMSYTSAPLTTFSATLWHDLADKELKIGVLAGASTPKSTVGAVIRKLDQLLNS